MAGIKVTDLPVLGAAAPDDVMYIVDTSTNTSKQIAVEDIVGGIPDIESGAWNPTPTNTGSTNPIVTIQGGNYSRVGTVVTCSLFLDLEMGTAENTAQFELDLPIASDFTNAKNAFGVIAYSAVGDGELSAWLISANTTSNKIVIDISSVTDAYSFQSIYATLQYVII
jgi:hypothetical protein